MSGFNYHGSHPEVMAACKLAGSNSNLSEKSTVLFKIFSQQDWDTVCSWLGSTFFSTDTAKTERFFLGQLHASHCQTGLTRYALGAFAATYTDCVQADPRVLAGTQNLLRIITFATLFQICSKN